MFPDLDPSRLSYGRLAAMVALQLLAWAVPLSLGVCTFAWLYGYHPSGRIELRSAPGNHRAFVENAGFVDAAYLLRACDWPWTFGRPFRVANLAAWPEAHYASTSHWTRDGSALVFVTQLTRDSAPEIEAGYDFKNHRGWDGQSSPSRPVEIGRWVTERGGLGPDLGFQDWKSLDSGQELGCPWWICVVAVGVVAATRGLLASLLKNRFPYPQNTLLEPE